jgi:hypothetical protein
MARRLYGIEDLGSRRVLIFAALFVCYTPEEFAHCTVTGRPLQRTHHREKITIGCPVARPAVGSYSARRLSVMNIVMCRLLLLLLH